MKWCDGVSDDERKAVSFTAAVLHVRRQPFGPRLLDGSRYSLTNLGKLDLGAARMMEARGLLLTDLE